MLLILLLLIPLITIFMIFTSKNHEKAVNIRKAVNSRILVLISTYTIIAPTYVIINISEVSGSLILVAIATNLAAVFFTSMYTKHHLPSIFSVLLSTLIYLLLVILVYPLLPHYISMFSEVYHLDFWYLYSYLRCFSLDTLLTDNYYYKGDRSPEFESMLKEKRRICERQHAKCKVAFDKFNNELSYEEKVLKFKHLMRVVGDRRDMCKELDTITGSKYSSSSFKRRDYSIFVSNYIRSITKNK